VFTFSGGAAFDVAQHGRFGRRSGRGVRLCREFHISWRRGKACRGSHGATFGVKGQERLLAARRGQNVAITAAHHATHAGTRCQLDEFVPHVLQNLGTDGRVEAAAVEQCGQRTRPVTETVGIPIL
jgi:hypothetical protein